MLSSYQSNSSRSIWGVQFVDVAQSRVCSSFLAGSYAGTLQAVQLSINFVYLSAGLFGPEAVKT